MSDGTNAAEGLLDASEIDALEDLYAEATPGAWRAETRETCTCGAPETHGTVRADSDGAFVVGAALNNRRAGSDARIIAALHNAAPRMLRAARAVARIAPMMVGHQMFLAWLGEENRGLADGLATEIAKELHSTLGHDGREIFRCAKGCGRPVTHPAEACTTCRPLGGAPTCACAGPEPNERGCVAQAVRRAEVAEAEVARLRGVLDCLAIEIGSV